jgi:hypothetical protein
MGGFMATRTAAYLTEEELEKARIHWPTAYLTTDTTHGDAHGLFAELMGVSRNRAKQICYSFTYQQKSWFFNKCRFDRRVMVNLASRLKFGEETDDSLTEIIGESEFRVDRFLKARLKGNVEC